MQVNGTEGLCHDITVLFIQGIQLCQRNLSLGSPTQQIQSWYPEVDGDPCFTKTAFEALSQRVSKDKEEQKETLCSLMLDETAN